VAEELKKRIGICLLGVVSSFVGFAILIQINGSLSEENESAVERLAQIIWRNDYLFSPIVVTIVSLVVSFLDRSRYKFFLVFITLLPFILFQLVASSFSARGLLFSVGYLSIGFAVALLIPNRAGASGPVGPAVRDG
jgi:ammonia channel protein AmtB